MSFPAILISAPRSDARRPKLNSGCCVMMKSLRVPGGSPGFLVQKNRKKTSKYVAFPQCYIRYLWVANMIYIYI